jgi:drug/metabolite transporter (DMT)-like permease
MTQTLAPLDPLPTVAPPAPAMPRPAFVSGAVVVMCLIWGSTWLVIKEGLRDLPPLTSAGARFALAAPLMALTAAWLRRREGGVRPPVWLALVVGTLNFGVSFGVVYTVETILPSGLVAVLWAVYPLMMAAIGHYFLHGERLGLRHAAGFCLSFAGVAVLFAADLERFGANAVPAAALLLVSPFVSAIGHAMIKRYASGASSLVLNRDAMTVGAVILLSLAFVREKPLEVRWTTLGVASLLYLSVFGTVVALSLYFWLLRYVRASRLGMIAFITPMIALLLGTLFGGEDLTWRIAAGSALIIGGVASTILFR